jgi:hypothetical protein
MPERDRLPILLGTRRYQTDLRAYSRRPLASIRQQVDQGQEPGEQSFDNQGIWKRTQSDFILGAGQRYFDQEDEADRRRWRASKGIDPWNRRQLRLLKDTASVGTLGNGDNGILLATSSHLFAASGTAVSKYTAADAATAITNLAGTISDLTVWGDYVYICATGQTVRRVALSGSAATTDFGVTTPTKARVVLGRMVCTDDNVIYELDSSGAKVGLADIFAHPQSTFEFHTITAAPNGVYVVGDDNNNSVVYLLTVVDATGEFAAPYPVMETLQGEFIRDMVFYGGMMFLATSKGVRLATINGSGFLTFGPLISEPGDVRGLAVWDKYVWFTWTNYDATSTGIGRLGPQYFTEAMIPAYASDLMYTAQGPVYDVAVFNNRPYFIYDNGTSARVVREHATNYVASGEFLSGGITYGTPERKAVLAVEAAWDSLPAGTTVTGTVYDAIGGTGQQAFTDDTDGSKGDSGSPATAIEAEELELKLTLATTTVTNTPVVRRWTLRSQPLPFRAEELAIPVNLNSRVDDAGQEVGQDPYEEFTYLHGLMTGRSRVAFEMGFSAESRTVVVDSIEPLEGRMTAWDTNRRWPEGWWLVRLITMVT